MEDCMLKDTLPGLAKELCKVYPCDKVFALWPIYRDWCVLTSRCISEHNFRAFVLGQPPTYWDILPPRTHTCLFNGWQIS